MFRTAGARLFMTDLVCAKTLFKHKKVTKYTAYGLIERTKDAILKDLEMAKEAGGNPGSQTFLKALELLGGGGVSVCRDVMNVYKGVNPADVAVYLKYLEICGEAKAGKAAVAALMELHERNLVVTVRHVYHTMMACRYSDLLVEKVVKFCETTDASLLTPIVREKAIGSCETFEAAFNYARRWNITSSRHFIALMYATGRAGDVSNVKTVENFREKQQVHKVPIAYFNQIMKVYKDSPDPASALSIYDAIEQQRNLSPDIFTYNLLILTYVRLSTAPSDEPFKKAESTFARALPLCTTPHLYTSLMSLYAKHAPKSASRAGKLLEAFQTAFKREEIPTPLHNEYVIATGRPGHVKIREIRGNIRR